MTRYVVSSIRTGEKEKQQLPVTLGVYKHQAEAVMNMHKEARAYLKELLYAKFDKVLPSSIKVKLDLRKVPAIQFAQIAQRDSKVEKWLTKEGVNTLDQVRVGGDYAMLYVNKEETWVDVVRLHERVPRWWQWGGTVVEFDSLVSFVVQPVHTRTSRAKRNAPSGTDPQAYEAWCTKRDQLMRDLNKKLAEKAKHQRKKLSNSVLRLAWD